MAMELWRPLREMQRLTDEMDRMFEGMFVPFERDNEQMGRMRMFPMNVYQKNNELMVEASLPGIKPEDVEVNVAGRTLTIKAERKETSESKREDYYRREMFTGHFFRQISLPSEIQADKAEATFENGELKLRLPLAQATKEVPIKVKGGAGQQTLGQGQMAQGQSQGQAQGHSQGQSGTGR